MFEIRVICAPTEAPEITKALSATFTTGYASTPPATVTVSASTSRPSSR